MVSRGLSHDDAILKRNQLYSIFSLNLVLVVQNIKQSLVQEANKFLVGKYAVEFELLTTKT